MTILTFGDSVTVGAREGVADDQTYSVQLENLLNRKGQSARVIAKGKRSENTNGALQRLPEELGLMPDYVTIMHGLNDAAVDAGKDEPRIPVTEYSHNLEAMIAIAKGAGVRPVLLTCNPMCSFGVTEKLYGVREPYFSNGINFLTRRYAEAMQRTGEKQGVIVVNIYSEFFKRATSGRVGEFLTDGMHPNPAGHTIIAEMVAEYFLGRK